MSKIFGAITVDAERCKGCGLCVEACPLDLLALAHGRVNTKGYPYVEQHDAERCTGCTSCAVVCPDACVAVYRKKAE